MVELEAIFLCLQGIASRPNNQPPTYLALTALSNTHAPHPIVSCIQTLLASLAQDIILIWIPSHRGIQRNETVDSLAKSATNLLHIDSKFLPSKSDLSAFIHQKISHHWVTTWQQPRQTRSSKLNTCLSFARHPTIRTADGTKSYSLVSESVILDSPMHIFSPHSHPFHVITASWITPWPLCTFLNAHPSPLAGPVHTYNTPWRPTHLPTFQITHLHSAEHIAPTHSVKLKAPELLTAC